MKNALIIHGTCDKEEYFSDQYPSLSNSHWLPWLQKQLLMNNILTQTPEMPDAYLPDPGYEKWSGELAQFTLNEDSILIGHSCGAGFLLRYLSENKINISKLILVAPWLDPEREDTTSFFDFEIDTKLVERIKEIHLFISKNDQASILKSAVIIKDKIATITNHEFSNLGHFISKHMKTDKFPELLAAIIS